ncbi:hypothetical protein RRG08_036360 [Elysia crispata]|uniref:Uncharacterized protein n=1 Tax=Elysia crispata TaxID=231223 RepID=A0AAE1DIK8_9GAST|nr:hypothetical protein RRG08_036360 [Elysia crispata]
MKNQDDIAQLIAWSAGPHKDEDSHPSAERGSKQEALSDPELIPLVSINTSVNYVWGKPKSWLVDSH